MSAYPQNYWKFSTVKKICDRVDHRLSGWRQGWQCSAAIRTLGHKYCACWGTHLFPRRTDRPALEHPWDCR